MALFLIKRLAAFLVTLLASAIVVFLVLEVLPGDPASIMLGFCGRAKSRELNIDTDELESGEWYHRDELLASPEDESFRLPRRDSIARRLVEDWLNEGV